jgi:hypothetical protein
MPEADDAHGIRHLPVLTQGRLVGVASIRDLLREAVEHHSRIIDELERERMLTSTCATILIPLI